MSVVFRDSPNRKKDTISLDNGSILHSYNPFSPFYQPPIPYRLGLCDIHGGDVMVAWTDTLGHRGPFRLHH